MADTPDFCILGAGSIGTFVGAILHQSGFKVQFLVRDSARGLAQIASLTQTGLTALCSADVQFRYHIAAEAIPSLFTTDNTVLQRCGCLLVCTKRVANQEVKDMLVASGVRGPCDSTRGKLCTHNFYECRHRASTHPPT